jgi:L-alanine-DL-glutamate epimerase-like enolase superfamily enzyme
MKIKNVELNLTKHVYKKAFHIAHSSNTTTENILVKLLYDNGIVGIGEASPSFRVNGEVSSVLPGYQEPLREMLIGMDGRKYAVIFENVEFLSKTSPSLKAAVQYAALDAFSKYYNTTVYEILGGKKEYVETDYTVSIGTIEESTKEAKELLKRGFKTIKVKVGEDVKTDIERMRAIAEVAPDTEFIIDANTGYTPKQAVYFADALYRDRIPVLVFEQPTKVNDIEGLKFVRYNSKFPVAADESAKNRNDAYKLIKENAVDFINIKLMKTGITDALGIIELARTASVKLMIGCMAESSIGISQSIHLAVGTGAFTYHDLDSHMLLKETKEYNFKQVGNKLYPI